MARWRFWAVAFAFLVVMGRARRLRLGLGPHGTAATRRGGPPVAVRAQSLTGGRALTRIEAGPGRYGSRASAAMFYRTSIHDFLAMRYPCVEAPSFSGGTPPQKTVANPASVAKRSTSA